MVKKVMDMLWRFILMKSYKETINDDKTDLYLYYIFIL